MCTYHMALIIRKIWPCHTHFYDINSHLWVDSKSGENDKFSKKNLNSHPNVQSFNFACAWCVPTVCLMCAHTIWRLYLENMDLCGSNAVSHVFLRQKLVSVTHFRFCRIHAVSESTWNLSGSNVSKCVNIKS